MSAEIDKIECLEGEDYSTTDSSLRYVAYATRLKAVSIETRDKRVESDLG